MTGGRYAAFDRLPPPIEYPPLGWPVGDAVLRPWFDWFALRAVVGWYFPLSRAWAAGVAARGAVERFLPDGKSPVAADCRIERALSVVERKRQAYEIANERWTEVFFGGRQTTPSGLVECEMARALSAHDLMSERRSFVPLRRHVPPVKWSIAPPDAVAAKHERRRAGTDPAFPAPDVIEVEESRRVPSTLGREYWLRFPSPVIAPDDVAWAHVYEPAGGACRSSILFLHGIGMEPEMWRGIVDPVNALVARGFRVIRPEAPWHGRRCPPGYYGGEAIFARGPLGFIDLLQAWVGEVAAWVRWARRTGSERIAVGGVSLGAFTAQLAATAARDWPSEMQPEALILVATTGDVVTSVIRSAIPRKLGLEARMADVGWRPGDFERWRSLFEPSGEPVMDPERIVMLLGVADAVTPYEGGRALAQAWGVPPSNRFVRWQGHFSVSLGLYRDPAPLDRLVAVL